MKNILNKVSTLGVVAAVATLVVLSNPLSNVELDQVSASGYGSAPTASSLKLNEDCRVNGSCTKTETKKEETKTEDNKKEEVKKEETKTEDKNMVGKSIEKEINGKKYTIMNWSNVLISRILKDTSDYKTNFTDISNSESKEDIIKLEMSNVVKGTTPTTYEPNRAITRAEFLAVVMGAYGYDLTTEAKALPFSDINTDWQKRVVSVALENKIIAGDVDAKGNKVFRPNSQISKIEALAIISKLSGIEVEGNINHTFVDSAADWQNAILAKAEYLELVKVPADKKFNPNAGISRWDMATLMVKYAKLY